ncbi:MAG TPA: hypothetical protein DD490_31045 [Acidobacteria bacterium]|nr:hypothetical protein [Acidobacteriota bacterium]
MKSSTLRNTFFAASLTLLALPALAQVTTVASIPPGKDFWVTPNNGQTDFNFPAGDVESLCGAPASATWNHKIALRGAPAPGTDYDTVVARLNAATFNSSLVATTPIQVVLLRFASAGSHATPCGNLNWTVSLSGPQATTMMTLRRTSATGGLFSADIAVNVEFQAFKSNGAYLGSLFYNIVLPDPATGTPWSIGPTGAFRAGMTPANDCIDVLREKLATYSPDSSHFYYISDMIAQGQCKYRG